MLIDIPSEVALRLQAMAGEQGCTVGELLQSLLVRGANDAVRDRTGNPAMKNPNDASPTAAPVDADDVDWSPPGSMAALALNARQANLSGGKFTDTSARSREILKAEFPDYIRRHQAE